MKKTLLLWLLSLFLLSCFSGQNNFFDEKNFKEIPLKYATHLKIFDCGGFYAVKIRNPWDTTKTLHSYILVDKNFNGDFSDFQDFTVIKTPVENTLVFTSLHASLLKTLGCKNAISSLCDVAYVLDKELLEDVKSGKIKDLGSSMSPDIERIMLQKPEIIMLSPYESSGGFSLLSKTKIPLVECADYMENSPLAQAEWIKFYALMFNKFDFAETYFSQVEKNYLTLKNLVDGAVSKPSLLPNSLTGTQWYMPTKNSTAGKFYVDAGFNFLFDYLDGYGTVPLDFEAVFSKAYDADFWIVKYNRDKDYGLESFSNENPNYRNFKALKNKNVYFCNLSYVPYYDETPFRPDFLLQDLIKIAHPELLTEYQLRYFKKGE